VRAVLGPADPEQRLGPAAKIRLAAEILRTYARVRWLLRRHDLPAAVAALEAGGPAGAGVDGGAALRIGRRLARSTCRCLAALPTDSRCLVRSLVLIALLARRGVASALVIGVRPGTDFAAHAWVERDDVPLLPTGDEAYARLVELGRQSDAAPA
jgi:Transglutaminase-like superfamily